MLAHLGLASRRQAEEWIRVGRLTVNGELATLGTRVRAADQIRLDGKLIRRHPAAREQVFIYHRSPGEALDRAPVGVSGAGFDTPTARAAAAASEHRPLVERMPRGAGRRFVAVSPMPQVDGGLELLTSDGELAAQLQRGVRRLVVGFSVRVRGELDHSQLQAVRAGALDRGVSLEVIACEARGGEGSNRWYTLSARGASGKDVRQLFERAGATVSRVLRTQIGPATLDRRLARGRFRKLAPAEVSALYAASGP